MLDVGITNRSVIGCDLPSTWIESVFSFGTATELGRGACAFVVSDGVCGSRGSLLQASEQQSSMMETEPE